MNLDIGGILGRAWRITWNNKVLWIFGILASLGGGSGSTNFNFGGGGGGATPGQPGNLPPEVQRFFDQLDPSVVTAVVLGLICVGLLLAIVIIALSVIGRGGLIGGVQRANAGDKVTFGQAWSIGVKHFWTLFLIGLVVGLVTFLAFILTVVPGALFTAVTFGLGALCLVPLICVLSIASIILGIVAYFAQIAAVVENLGVVDALRRAWQIIQANLGSIVVLGLIVIVLSAIVGFLLALPMIGIVLPAMFGIFALASGEAPQAGNATLIIAGLCFVIYLPVLIVLSGILQTWVTSVWTLAYEQFTGRSGSIVPAAPQAPAL